MRYLISVQGVTPGGEGRARNITHSCDLDDSTDGMQRSTGNSLSTGDVGHDDGGSTSVAEGVVDYGKPTLDK